MVWSLEQSLDTRESAQIAAESAEMAEDSALEPLLIFYKINHDPFAWEFINNCKFMFGFMWGQNRDNITGIEHRRTIQV